MPDETSERIKTLLASIHTEAEQLLIANEVYEISSYGWADHDTPDPDHVGHAMFQVSPPFQPDWTALLNGGLVSYIPTIKDEALLRAGEDFIGTMISARRSIGMALCCSLLSDKSGISEDIEFWHEYSTALQWLDIASDRIREFFLMATFGQTPEQYSNKKYVAPFHDASKKATHDNRNVLTKLSEIAKQIRLHRQSRNSIVHEMATRTAQLSLAILHDQRQRGIQKGQTTPRPATGLGMAGAHNVTSAIEKMKSWYKHLVNASSLVFEFEYFTRPR